MFGISASEFLVILCVALVFIRPKDLPRMLRSLGRSYARLRAILGDLRAEKDDFLAAIDREAKEEPSGKNPGEPPDKAFDPYRKAAEEHTEEDEGDGGGKDR
jgi:sec-independent protein translocase protein TatB